MTAIRGTLALVTGASQGIGLEIARRLAAQGAHVVLWARRRGPLEEAAARIAHAGGKADWATVDVADRAQVTAAAAALKARLGPVGILVNNAGIVSGKPLLELGDAEIERTLAVNTLAHFWTLRAFLPDMLERNEGHVVTVTSAAGICAAPRLADYSASKFATFGLAEALRAELRLRGSRVRTTVVCPFYIDTGMFHGVSTRFPWLLPILKTEAVGARVIAAIEKDRPRVVMPAMVYTTFLARLLPVSWFDGIATFLGLDRSMETFLGRAPEPKVRLASLRPEEPGRAPHDGAA
jgi:all-trans-retinol dehydrogenase (NAD+)